MFIFDTIGSFLWSLTTFFVGGTVVWLFIGVDAPAMCSFLMPSDCIMEFDDFLLEKLSSGCLFGVGNCWAFCGRLRVFLVWPCDGFTVSTVICKQLC